MWKIFKTELLGLRNQFIPIKEVDSQSWKDKGSIPIKKDVQDELERKRRLHRRWLRSKDPEEKAKNRTTYVSSRNKVCLNVQARARRSYEKNICDKSKSKPKVFWSHVRSKLKSASGVSSLLETPNGSRLYDMKITKKRTSSKSNFAASSRMSLRENYLNSSPVQIVLSRD